jgi:hypothetical protein
MAIWPAVYILTIIVNLTLAISVALAVLAHVPWHCCCSHNYSWWFCLCCTTRCSHSCLLFHYSCSVSSTFFLLCCVIPTHICWVRYPFDWQSIYMFPVFVSVTCTVRLGVPILVLCFTTCSFLWLYRAYAVQHGIPIICFVLFILGFLDSCLFGLLEFGLLTNASIHSKLRCYPITVGFCSQRHNIDWHSCIYYLYYTTGCSHSLLSTDDHVVAFAVAHRHYCNLRHPYVDIF